LMCVGGRTICFCWLGCTMPRHMPAGSAASAPRAPSSAHDEKQPDASCARSSLRDASLSTCSPLSADIQDSRRVFALLLTLAARCLGGRSSIRARRAYSSPKPHVKGDFRPVGFISSPADLALRPVPRS
jgi:hypothetical protein